LFVAAVKQRYGDMAGQFLKAYPADSDPQALESAYASYCDKRSWEMRYWARMQTKTGHRPAYRYYFSHRPPGPEGERLGAFHALDLAHVFGNFMIYPFPWDDTDRKLSETIMSYWTNFAKTGDPNGAGLPKWPAYDPADDNVLDFGDPVSVRTHVHQAELDFFDACHASLAAAQSTRTGVR
jgi:para-nitrobenzyl esterase